jgi:hypothetical protein
VSMQWKWEYERERAEACLKDHYRHNIALTDVTNPGLLWPIQPPGGLSCWEVCY